MRHLTVLTMFALALPAVGCASEPQDPFEEAAVEVELIAAALEDADADADLDALADRRQQRPHARHRHHHRLLHRFGNSGALEACRTQRDACTAGSDDPNDAEEQGCHENVRACVHAALEQAFDSMCSEHMAACESADAAEGPCERIAQHCRRGPRFPHGDHDAGVFGGAHPGRPHR